MPEIEIRPANSADIPNLINIDHNYKSDYVWQMDIKREQEKTDIQFRQTHLPRSVRVEYPRSPKKMVDDWQHRSGILVAVHGGEVVGYISFDQNIVPMTTWVTDLVVMHRYRRQGIGSALILAGQEWAKQHKSYRIILEMQPKNHPAICLVQKLGYDICGYNDRYYVNQDIALFFAKPLR
jgi:ribosomal protein S18 acetylase RimI-like enzyme